MATPSPSILKKVLEAGSMAQEHVREEHLNRDSEERASPFAIVGVPEVGVVGVEHFRLIMDHVPVAVAMLDLQMRYLLTNRSWMEDFDLGKQEVVGRSHYELFPMLHPGWRHVYDRALKGQAVRCDRDAMVRNGRELVYWWEVRPWRNADASIGGVMIMCSKLEGGSGVELKEGEEKKVGVEQMLGLEALWGGGLPMLQVDACGKILRASVGASMFLLPKGLREGETDFCEVLGERASRGVLRERVEAVLKLVLEGGKAQEMVWTGRSAGLEREGEMPVQWMFTKLGEGEALVVGLEGGQVLPEPSVGGEGVVVGQEELLEVKAAEKLSRERESRLRAVLDLAPCGVLVLDEKAKLVFQNARLANLLGRGVGEGQLVEQWLTVGSRDGVHAAELRRCWREDVWQRQLVQVMTLVSADDLLKEVEFRPVSLPGGGLMVILLDVTESRRSEEMLRSVEAKFRALVQENPLALVLTDRSGSVFDVNPAAEELLGYPRAELRRMRLGQWMDEQTVARRAEVLGEMADFASRSGDFGGMLKLADGSRLEVEMRVAVVLDSDRKALFTIHFMQRKPEEVVVSAPVEELGHLKVAVGELGQVTSGDDFLLIGGQEREREDGEDEVKVVVSGVELLSTDAHGRVLSWTEAAEEVFGYGESEMGGRGLHLMFRPSDATGFYHELSKQHALAFAGHEVEWTFFHKERGRSEGRFLLEAVGDSPLSVRMKTLVKGVVQPEVVDVREEPQAVVEEVDLTQQRLLIGETHQRVKDQLQVITTMLNLQLNTVRNEQAREALRSSQNRIGSIAALHQHLAKLGGGEAMDFRAFAGGLIARLRECFGIDEEQVELELEVNPRVMPEGWMLPLSLALNEMVSNAFKHGFSGGREGLMKVRLDWNDEGGALTVTDNGKGLAADFDDHQHEGMGLKILRVFAGQLGGEVRISSGMYGGGEVEMWFPVKVEEDGEEV